MWSTRPGCARWERGGSTRNSSPFASPSSAASWITVASTTAATSPSRAARCVRPRRTTSWSPTAWSPTSGSTRRSTFLLGPAVGFAQGHERLRGIVNAELPPLVAPFRGERFASRDRLGALVAPPYDVISKEERARYAAQDPHNIVHLILPEAAGGDRYAHAAAQLAAWRDAGVLRADPADSVYVVAQDYTLPSGERRTRTGMFAAVRAEPFSTRRVRPHEQTHSAPKADRLALLRATRTNLESIFL